MYRGHEMPHYAVERIDGPFEVRRYAPYTVAETRIEGSRSSALSRGLRTLTRAIVGGTARGRRLPMTVPVEQTPGAPSGWLIRFIVSGPVPEVVPEPAGQPVLVRQKPGERLAVVRFSGLATGGRLSRQELRLRGWAKRQGLPLTLSARHLYYDRPTTLPWRRRNEVAVAIA